MIPLTPMFLIATARGLVGVRHQQDGRGAWSAAFVYHAGYWSHFDDAAGRSSWPLSAAASCDALAAFATKRDVLTTVPRAGDVFLLWHAPEARFAHTGVVTFVRDRGTTPGGTKWFDCDTIEGNTDAEHGCQSDRVVRTARRFYPDLGPDVGDRFIRWPDLDARHSAGQPLWQWQLVA